VELMIDLFVTAEGTPGLPDDVRPRRGDAQVTNDRERGANTPGRDACRPGCREIFSPVRGTWYQARKLSTPHPNVDR